MTLLITSIRLLAKVPFLLNLPLPVIVVWAGLTVLGALAMIIWRREQLKKTHWADLLPPAVLAFIALSYTVFALQASRPDLALLMAGTGIPLWSAFGLSLRHA
jgi:tryptophan-rich sensory protein